MAEKIQELFKEHFNGSINVNKAIIKQYGTDSAVFLGELISKQKYWEEKGELEDGFFYWSMQDIKEATGLGRRPQERIIPKLVKSGMITVKRQPRHPIWFKVNVKVVKSNLAYVQNGHSGMSKKDTGLCPKGTTTNPLTNPDTNGDTPTYNGSKGKNNVSELVGIYMQLFREKVGKEPQIVKGRDHGILKDLIDKRGFDETKKLIELWFDHHNETEYTQGFPLHWLPGKVNNLLGKMSLKEGHREFGENCRKCKRLTFDDEKECKECGEAVNGQVRYL